MITDPLFQAILFGSFFALGVGFQQLRFRRREKRKARRRFGLGYSRNPEPQMGRWTAQHGERSWR